VSVVLCHRPRTRIDLRGLAGTSVWCNSLRLQEANQRLQYRNKLGKIRRRPARGFEHLNNKQKIAVLIGYHNSRRGTFTAIGVPSMCDYSLHLVASRPAKVGDKLVTTNFPHTDTRGFASVDDRNVVVCVLPGTELAFEEEVRTSFVLSWRLGHTVAKFRQVNKGRPNVHHDALEFPDGKIVLLTHLCKGQRATILQLPARVGVTADDVQPHDSTLVRRVTGLVARVD
jgi:hypothetical protein